MLHLNFIAEELVSQVKSGQDGSTLQQQLATADINEMFSLGEEEKKSFWINLYNAYNLILLDKLKTDLKKPDDRKKHFRSKLIVVAGNKFSLDDIEHGILRRSKIKNSFGYLNKLFPSGLEKKLRVKKLDYRIHFALNCGGLSCPPIRNYNHKNIEEQLETAERSFCETEITFENDSICLSKIFKWYWKDFGGRAGINRLIEKYSSQEVGVKKMIFKEYIW